MVKYITFSISIAFISWIVGMIINAILIRTAFYREHLSDLMLIKNETLRKSIGLGIFKWVVQHTFFKYFNPKLSMKKKIKLSELDDLREAMTVAEVSHLIAFGFVMVFAFIKILNGDHLFAFIITAVNVLMNLYPSLLQQENKVRMDLIIKRLKPKAGTVPSLT